MPRPREANRKCGDELGVPADTVRRWGGAEKVRAMTPEARQILVNVHEDFKQKQLAGKSKQVRGCVGRWLSPDNSKSANSTTAA
jgi:hypothetical protein